MKTEDETAYQRWLQSKKEIEIPTDLADRVMRQVTQEDGPGWKNLELWTKAALIALFLVGGMGRFGIFLICLLSF